METTLPIEDVLLGYRVPSRNPASDESLNISPPPDYLGWKVICMEVKHRNGSIVDVQLMRSEDWIERNGLQIGAAIDLQLTEIEVEANGFVVSIEDGPEIMPGDGAVVTGRFVTREGSDLVRVTFEDGTQLIGTTNHPVWSPLDWDWRCLGEFEPGQFVYTRAGLLAVASVEKLPGWQPLYNIEVDGEHVYEVTAHGILVHNGNPLCEELLKLRIGVSRGPLPAAQAARLAELEVARAAAEVAVTSNAVPELGKLFERVIETSQGKITLLAEVELQGEKLILKDVVIYGDKPIPLTGLTNEIFAARRQLIEEAKAMGFKELQITGKRVLNSSSANPGHIVDVTIDLTKK